MLWEDNYLAHYGIKGQKWGVRRFQNPDGSLTEAGKKRYNEKDTVFISGSSKTQDKSSGYYRKDLPKEVRKEINSAIQAKSKIIVGDAPGIDRQVQDYLNKKRYNNVEVYGPGKEVRYSANKNWKTNPIDDPDHEPMSKEWLAKKDIAMANASTKGLAVVLDEGANATRNNIARLQEQNKDVKVFSINKNFPDQWSTNRFDGLLGSIKAKAEIDAYKNAKNDSDRQKAGEKMLDSLAEYDRLMNKELYSDSNDKRSFDEKWKEFNDRYPRENAYNDEISYYLQTELGNKSMNIHEGIPKSDRQKALYEYNPSPDGIKTSFDTYENWIPKYKKTKAYKDTEKQIEKAAEESGLYDATDLWYNRGKYKKENSSIITMRELDRRSKILREASEKYQKLAKAPIEKQNEMQKEHELKILKNALLDMGWPVNDKNISLIRTYMW